VLRTNVHDGEGRTNEALRKEALWVVAWIGVVAFVIGFPAYRGELLLYVDNPAHLSEIRDLARPNHRGWSDLAMAGFPLHLLQPPLTYGGLARLTRLGVPLEPVYTLMTWLGLMAPATAFYFAVRTRLPAVLAAALAITLLLYRASTHSLGGMFGFYFAVAAWIGVLVVLAKPQRALRDFAVLALLTAIIGLTHMYVTIALVYLGVVHAAWSLGDAASRRRFVGDAAALALGAAASASYWLSNAMARTAAGGHPEPLHRIVARLFLTGFPNPPPELRGFGDRLAFDPAHFLDALPQLAVVVAAVGGFRWLLRDGDRAARYGLSIAALFLGLLLIQPIIKLPLLGPQGDRLIYVAKVGMLFSAVPFMKRSLERFAAHRAAPVIVGALGLGFGLLLQPVVAFDTVPKGDPDVADVGRTWQWLRENKSPAWGRVYLQDTFGVANGPLGQSHVLARTSEQTGVEQVGAFYGSTPYDKDALWTSFDPRDVSVDGIVSVMQRANATHFVLSDPRLRSLLGADERFTQRFTAGRFTVYERTRAVSRWADALGGGAVLRVERLEPGHLRLGVAPGTLRVRVSESHHPFWRSSGSTLRRDQDGLLLVERASGEAAEFDLLYAPPLAPIVISVTGVVVILGLVIFAGRFRARIAPRAS
jgi:hypothetical protein